MSNNDRAESEKQTPHNTRFLTGEEVRQVDDDPVLERRDIWGGESD